MRTLRTPDSRFEGLDLPYSAKYVDIDGGDGAPLRMHYWDEGPRDADELLLLLHGEPTWAFVYRHVIARCTNEGIRCVAPDLVGFGRSDKPVDRADHTYDAHVRWVTQFIDALGLRDISMICHDWGGLIGLRMVAAQPDRFSRVIATNTGLPTGDRPPVDAFTAWRQRSQADSDLDVGGLVQSGCTTPLTSDVVAAYNAPFPDESFKAGVRQLPMLVPTRPDDPASEANRTAWASLSAFSKPFLTVFSGRDPITAGVERALQRAIPGAAGQRHAIVPHAGHFIPEDAADDLARMAVAFCRP